MVIENGARLRSCTSWFLAVGWALLTVCSNPYFDVVGSAHLWLLRMVQDLSIGTNKKVSTSQKVSLNIAW